MRLLLEIVPILLAMVAMFMCGYRALVTNNKVVRNYCLMAVIAAILMLTAQVSWSWSMFIKNSLLGTDFSNIIWTVFNALTMLTFIYAAHWVEKK